MEVLTYAHCLQPRYLISAIEMLYLNFKVSSNKLIEFFMLCAGSA